MIASKQENGLIPSPFMNPKTSNQPENAKILEAIQIYSTSVDSQLHDIRNTMSRLVTKDYLEERLSKRPPA